MVIGLESTWVLIAKPIVIFAFVLGIVPIILWIEATHFSPITLAPSSFDNLASFSCERAIK